MGNEKKTAEVAKKNVGKSREKILAKKIAKKNVMPK